MTKVSRLLGFLVSGLVHGAIVLLAFSPLTVAEAPQETIIVMELAAFHAPAPAAMPTEHLPASPDVTTTPPASPPEPVPASVPEQPPTEPVAQASIPAPREPQPLPSKPAEAIPASRKPAPKPQPSTTASPIIQKTEAHPATAQRNRVESASVDPPASLPEADAARLEDTREQARAAYLAALTRAIAERKHYPRQSRRRAEQGTAVVAFDIDSSGAFTRIAIVQSSGHERLDNAALDAVRELGQFDRIPTSLQTVNLAIRVPVRFQLR